MRTRSTTTAAGLLVVGLMTTTLTACGNSGGADAASTPGGVACPTTAVATVVSVDQWGDIVAALGGSCAEVTTVIESSAADPHDYEPTVGDIGAFSKAKLVVINGVDYDPWAARAAKNAGADPVLLDAGVVAGVSEGANPHLWYSPQYVSEVADAVTAQLKQLAPAAASYFDDRAAAWDMSMKPYFSTIAAIKKSSAGEPFAATETVFDYMAQACGLTSVTPKGYQNASANESDPAPGDVAAFDEALAAGKAKVLIYNKQTSGSVPEQLRRAAGAADVPVVDVTESVPPGVATFDAWQVGQLKALQNALAG